MAPLDVAAAFAVFADAAARGIGLKQIRLRPGALPESEAVRLGYRNNVRTVRHGYLERIGVPLWRDGTAPFSLSLYYRGVWAAIALLIGLGSVSLAVFSSTELTWLHIVLPAVVCGGTAVFAVWQIVLVVAAARRSGNRLVFSTTAGLAAATVVLAAAAIYDRALPALAELWTIYTGDAELANLAVVLSPDGKTLRVDGSYSTGSEAMVEKVLQGHAGIREVVLSGPGGRVSVGFALNRMFRQRRLATHVDAACASACTIAFLGGVERSVSARGRLGFHQMSFPGMGESDMYESNRDMKRFLVRGAGVTPEFAQRVVDTPPGSLWVPTPTELLAAKVIHRVKP